MSASGVFGASINNPPPDAWAFDGPDLRPAVHGVLAQGRLGEGPAARPFAMRRLTAADLPALDAFRAEIFAGLPDPDMYVPESPGFMEAHIARAGVTLGVESDGRLVAYGVLGVPRGGMPSFGDDLPDLVDEKPALCHLSSVMVAPALRGAGLQRRMIEWRMLLAIGLGRRHVLARVALSNERSLARLLEAGLCIRRVLRMHHDRLRFLLHRDFAAASRPAAKLWRPIGDPDGLQALLSGGAVGVATAAAADGGLLIGFAQEGDAP